MFSCYGKRVMLEKPSEERAMHRVWEQPRQRSCWFTEPAAQPRERRRQLKWNAMAGDQRRRGLGVA